MARSRRNTEVEFNFDSLTDCVTNLVGALLLLILLVVAITDEAVSQEASPAPAPTVQAQPAGMTHTDSELKNRLERIEAGTANAKTQVKNLNDEIDRLEKRLEELLQKSKSVQPAPKETKEPDPPTDEPRKISFRPPMEHLVEKSADFVFIANGGFAYVRQVTAVQLINKTKTEGAAVIDELPLTYSVANDDGSLILKIRPEYKKLFRGIPELTDVIRAHETKDELDKSRQMLEFVVYPDSFDAFAQARNIVVQAGFDYKFTPIASNNSFELGFGGSQSAD